MRVLVTRPKEDALPLMKRLEELGVQVLPEPLLFIEYLDGEKLDLTGAQALLVTSANGIRALARRYDGRDLPVYAVGGASARTAFELGFTKVESANGDVLALAELVAKRLDPGAGFAVHAAGSEVAGDLKGVLEKLGFDYRRQLLYRARAAGDLSAETAKALADKKVDGALFFSPRTAEAFVKLVERAGLAASCRFVAAFCLSQAVAGKIGVLAWKEVRVAAHPNQESLLKSLGF